jgi:NADPH:quinone reductase-like Zn-dependent oxidoreductase
MNCCFGSEPCQLHIMFLSHHMSSIVLQAMQIHGGGSGIGTFAIQIAKAKDVKVFITAGK